MKFAVQLEFSVHYQFSSREVSRLSFKLELPIAHSLRQPKRARVFSLHELIAHVLMGLEIYERAFNIQQRRKIIFV